ncbi:AsmA family protein [Elioraea sp.]|uniref:AsmA family protein n=1 Tax=Elioraea sp. TaxID=2185103 RepID=UPI0025B8F570|nr:AsmA family protein [Elioraea sp.]
MSRRTSVNRRRAIILLIIAAVPLAIVAATLILLPGIELGPAVARRLEAQLGRTVTITSLRLIPRRSIRIELRDVRVANIDGGTAPAMATLGRLSAELDVLPLLRGRVVVRSIDVAGFSLLLERAADRRANWRFGTRGSPTETEADARASVPTILDLRLSDSEVTFRTTSGTMLRTVIATARGTAADASQPITLGADGSYNDVPIALRATLGSFDALRDAGVAFPVALEAVSGDTTLTFRGTSRHPLDADGLDGALALNAPTVATLLAIGGVDQSPPVSLTLSGHATRQDTLWRLTDIEGELDGAPFTGASLALTEGASGEPESIAATLAFTRLDFDKLLASPGGEGADDGPDMPLRVALAPDPLVTADISAEAFTYGRLQARDARLKGEIAPSRITLQELSLFGFGAQLSGRVDITPAGDGARLVAEAELRESDLDALRRSVGFGPLPVTGRVHGRLAMEAEGTALNEALRGADGTLVLGMSSGRIAREVIEMASTDVRALFRTAEGTTQVTCMLAVVVLRDGAGDVAPLHLRAGTGAVSGIATFDLNRRWLDLVIGSRRETTHTLALDIPVRVSGRFADLSFEPAAAGPEERAQQTGARHVAALPPSLRDTATGNACYRSAMGRR